MKNRYVLFTCKYKINEQSVFFFRYNAIYLISALSNNVWVILKDWDKLKGFLLPLGNKLTNWLHGAEAVQRSQRGPQLVKHFPAFCGARLFIAAFTRTRHLILSGPDRSSIWPSPLLPSRTFLQDLLILSSYSESYIPIALPTFYLPISTVPRLLWLFPNTITFLR